MSDNQTSGRERRSNLLLRALIDEMLEQVREINRAMGEEGAAERARAEAQLDAIMARVRQEALRKHTESRGDGQQPAGQPTGSGSEPDKTS